MASQSGPVTYQAIAEAVGVAKSTVARALAGSPEISTVTRRKVLRAAERLGYVPDPRFKVLAMKRWKRDQERLGTVIAYLIVPMPTQPLFLDDLHQRHLAGVRRTAERMGYTVEVFRANEFTDSRHLDQVLWSRGIQGIIFGPAHNPTGVPRLRWDRYSCVACGYGPVPLPFHGVRWNFFTGFQLAWKEVVARGYRKIGINLAYHEYGCSTEDERTQAAALYCMSRPASHEVVPMHFCSYENLRAGVADWYARHRPEVIIAPNVIALYALVESGVRVPESVGFLGLHVHPPAEPITIAGGRYLLSGICPRQDIVGEEAVRELHGMLCRYEKGLPARPVTRIIEPEWMEGETLPDRSAQPGTPAPRARRVSSPRATSRVPRGGRAPTNSASRN